MPIQEKALFLVSKFSYELTFLTIVEFTNHIRALNTNENSKSGKELLNKPFPGKEFHFPNGLLVKNGIDNYMNGSKRINNGIPLSLRPKPISICRLHYYISYFISLTGVSIIIDFIIIDCVKAPDKLLHFLFSGS
jgi:hypothetical protein